MIGDVNNRNLGVDYVGWRPKPAEKALSFFNTLYGQKYQCIDSRVQVKRPKNSDSEVHAFQMEDGSLTVVAWLKTNVKGRKLSGPIGNLKDTRKETVAVIVPSNASGKAVMYTELGESKPYENVSAGNGQLSIKGLDLVGGQIAILKIGK